MLELLLSLLGAALVALLNGAVAALTAYLTVSV
jgi:hypothetical protein